MSQLRGEQSAMRATAAMRACTVVDLTASLAVTSARISIDEGLPMADSIILATARAHDATLWTQDSDFERIAGVKYLAKRSAL